MLAGGIIPFLVPPQQSHRTGSQVPYLRLFKPDSQYLPHPGDYLRPCTTQLSGPPKLFLATFPYKWLALVHDSDIPKFSQASSIWLQQVLYHSLSCPSPGTSSSQAWFTACPFLGTPKPSTNSSHLQITCSLCCVTPDRTQAVADLGCANSNQGSTTRGSTQSLQ